MALTSTKPKNSRSNVRNCSCDCGAGTHVLFTVAVMLGIRTMARGLGLQHVVQEFLYCIDTAEFAVTHITPKLWILQSYDEDGLTKAIGGDEMYVSMQNATHTHAVGHTTDLFNGSYAITWHRLKEIEQMNITVNCLEKRNITISLTMQYSCGKGSLPPPRKLDWKSGGQLTKQIAIQFQIQNLSLPIKFQQEGARSAPLSLHNFQEVHLVGDSLMQQLYVGHRSSDRNKKIQYTRIQAPLATDTLQSKFIAPITSLVERLEHQAGALVVLGSGIWDLLENGSNESLPYMSVSCCKDDFEFNDHIKAMDILLSNLSQKFPLVTFAWKSITAVHIHAIQSCNTKGCSERTKYMSTSRAHMLYKRQALLLRTKYPNIRLIDLYYISFNRAHLMKKNDGRHYKCDGKDIVSNMCIAMWRAAFVQGLGSG
jgi:hypothetical protein